MAAKQQIATVKDNSLVPYKVLSRVGYDGEFAEIGSEILLTPADAAHLIECGTIRPLTTKEEEAITAAEARKRTVTASISEIEADIAKNEDLLAKAHSLRPARQSRIAEISDRRRALTIAKISGQDCAAEMQKLNAELDVLVREENDHDAAIAQVNQTLTGLRSDLEVAEMEQKRAELRSMIMKDMKDLPEQKLAGLATELCRTLKQIKERDARIGAALESFHPKFKGYRERINDVANQAGYHAAYFLKNEIPVALHIDLMEHFAVKYDICALAMSRLEMALARLDRLDLRR